MPSPPAVPPWLAPTVRMPGRLSIGSSRPTSLRWRRGPTSIRGNALSRGADTSLLPVPGLFTDVAQLVDYAATRSEDLVLQLRIMLDAIGDDGRPGFDPKALVRLCATGRAMLKNIEAFELPPEAKNRGDSGPAVAIASPGAG